MGKFKDFVLAGAYHLRNGATTDAAWSKRMLDVFGPGIRPYLRDILKQSRKVPSWSDVAAVERINCWDFNACGREPEGRNAEEQGCCRASVEKALDGMHGGKNAGRACWVVAGSFGPEPPEGTVARKVKNCDACGFYQTVRKQEAGHFVERETLSTLYRIQRDRSDVSRGSAAPENEHRGRTSMAHSILVVDDEPNIVLSLEFLMKKEGYAVRTAVGGEEAMAALRADVPDLVLLDVMMPRPDGYEVCQAIRANPAWRDIAVVMLTAKGREIEREKGLAVGADDYVTKPFATRDLVEKVRSMLAEKADAAERGLAQDET